EVGVAAPGTTGGCSAACLIGLLPSRERRGSGGGVVGASSSSFLVCGSDRCVEDASVETASSVLGSSSSFPSSSGRLPKLSSRVCNDAGSGSSCVGRRPCNTVVRSADGEGRRTARERRRR